MARKMKKFSTAAKQEAAYCHPIMLPSRCFERGCRHYIGVAQPDGTEMTEMHVCEAFPDGIPNSIENGKNLHLKPLRGQKNNIVFEQGDIDEEENQE